MLGHVALQGENSDYRSRGRGHRSSKHNFGKTPEPVPFFPASPGRRGGAGSGRGPEPGGPAAELRGRTGRSGGPEGRRAIRRDYQPRSA